MRRKITIVLFLGVLVLMLAPVLSVSAQGNEGSIRGTVINDLNADGQCLGTGEPGQSNVPVEFMYLASGTTVPLVTGVDGSYGIVNITLGTWQITVKPGDGWVVTSQQVKQVTLTEAQPVVTGIDFCITQVPVSGGGTTPPPTLPESGAAIAPILLVAIAAGGLMLLLGAGLVIANRR